MVNENNKELKMNANQKIKVGSLVVVGWAYVGGGQFAPDGTEGGYTVVKELDMGDWYLARGDQRKALEAGEAEWDVIVNESRMVLAK